MITSSIHEYNDSVEIRINKDVGLFPDEFVAKNGWKLILTEKFNGHSAIGHGNKTVCIPASFVTNNIIISNSKDMELMKRIQELIVEYNNYLSIPLSIRKRMIAVKRFQALEF